MSKSNTQFRQTQITPCLEESPLHIPLIFPTQDAEIWTRIFRVCSKWYWGSEHQDSNGQLLLHPNTRAPCVVDITPAGYVVLSAAPCQRHCLFAMQNYLTCPWGPHCTVGSTTLAEAEKCSQANLRLLVLVLETTKTKLSWFWWFPKPTAEQIRCAEMQWTRSSKMPMPEHYWRVISSYWSGKGRKRLLCWPSAEGWGWGFWDPKKTI